MHVKSLTLLLIISFVVFELRAKSLNEIIEHAIKNRASLLSMRQEIEMKNQSRLLSKKLENPTVSLQVNDVQLNNIDKRNIEPMQFEAIIFKQKIPLPSRLKLNERVATLKLDEAKIELDEAQSELRFSIKKIAFSIWKSEELLKIIDENIKLIDESIKLSVGYLQTTNTSQMRTASFYLSKSTLMVKKEQLKNRIKSSYKRVSYLADYRLKELSLSLSIEEPSALKSFAKKVESNPTLRRLKSVVESRRAEYEVADFARYPDLVLSAGYYHREAYENYLSFQLSLSLPVYGSEKVRVQRAIYGIKEAQESYLDTKERVLYLLKERYIALSDAKETYELINRDVLHEIEHSLKLARSAIEVGANLFEYNEILRKKLSFEEQSVNAIADYHTSLAAIEALIGEGL